MHRFLMALAVGVAFSAPVAAADMVARPYHKAPPPVIAPAYSWTGCYVGIHGGGIWKRNEDATVSVFDGGSGVAAAVAGGAIPTRFSPAASSWLAGGQIGCNYQVSKWMLGVETDISGIRLDANQTINTAAPGFFALTSSVSQNMSWIGTTRGRVGYAFDNVLLFATAGAAYARLNYAWSGNNVVGGGELDLRYADSATNFGWTAGGGIEVGMGKWSIKGEALYYDLGTHSLSGLCTTVTGAICLGDTMASRSSFTTRYSNRGGLGRVGLNYRF